MPYLRLFSATSNTAASIPNTGESNFATSGGFFFAQSLTLVTPAKTVFKAAGFFSTKDLAAK